MLRTVEEDVVEEIYEECDNASHTHDAKNEHLEAVVECAKCTVEKLFFRLNPHHEIPVACPEGSTENEIHDACDGLRLFKGLLARLGGVEEGAEDGICRGAPMWEDEVERDGSKEGCKEMHSTYKKQEKSNQADGVAVDAEEGSGMEIAIP